MPNGISSIANNNERGRAELTVGSDWSPGFFEQLGTVAPETIAAVDELLTSVCQARTSKPSWRL
jgi:hypothetical protein